MSEEDEDVVEELDERRRPRRPPRPLKGGGLKEHKMNRSYFVLTCGVISQGLLIRKKTVGGTT